MKKTDTYTKVIAAVLFAAMAIYLFGWLWRSTHNNVVTAPVTAATISDGIQANGIAVREETVLTTNKQYVSIQAEDSKAVAAGAVLANAVGSETELEKMNHIAELKQEISSLQNYLSQNGTSGTAGAAGQESSIRRSVLTLTTAVARGEIADVSGAAMNLSSLVLQKDASTDNQTKLDALKKELAGYGSSAGSSAALTAKSSGVFSRSTDGYEGLNYAALENLTVTKLDALLQTPQDTPAGAYGRLVTENRWYFAATIDSAKADRLTVGKTTYLEFPRYHSDKIQARVESISAAESGRVAVVFSTDRALTDTLTMRKATASVVFSEASGLRVPVKAMHVDDKGTFVYCVTAQRVEKKYVSILSTQKEFYLVDIGQDADSLREGNTIVVSGKDISEGKVVNK